MNNRNKQQRKQAVKLQKIAYYNDVVCQVVNNPHFRLSGYWKFKYNGFNYKWNPKYKEWFYYEKFWRFI